ncbi:3606_t:CDS:1 [Dentiscutata erythropus]|uniref:3606_t:CDS:1 n=1 Tax=Dentiscutata erythropus TaxID=1348616 RepID=A0A9N9AAA4_9GLOM|nr:3606_t:CDS:1 [Dentiscutata erythropus]
MSIKLSRQSYASSSTQSRPVRTFPKTEELESIISKIVKSEERKEIESKTFLSLHDLIVPSLKPKRAGPPRAQNCFLIFRKDLQASMKSQTDLRTSSNGLIFRTYLKQYLQNYMPSPDDKTSGMKIVSNTAFKMWTSETEIKQVYIQVSKIAKAVHKFMWPDYKYQPNRKKRIQNSFLCEPYTYIPEPSQQTQTSYSRNFVPFTRIPYQPNRKKCIQNSFRCEPYTYIPEPSQQTHTSYSHNFVPFTRIPHITQLDVAPSKLNYSYDRSLCQSVDRHVVI